MPPSIRATRADRLINLRGEVVGINTAIFSRTGGNIGIGFAIPVNLAKELVPQLRDKGKVTRGWLGVFIQKVTPEIADRSVWSRRTAPWSPTSWRTGRQRRPASKSATSSSSSTASSQRVERAADAGRAHPDGQRVRMKVVRDKEMALNVDVGELKDEEVRSRPREGELGLTVQRLTPEIAESLGLEKTKGVVVGGRAG